MNISEDDVIGRTEKDVWDSIWEQLRDEFGINSCDKCGMIDKSTDLIWIDAEDFKPLEKDKFNEEKYKEAIKERYSALCDKCYKELCCG